MESLVIPNIYGLVRPMEEPVNRILLQERWKPDSDTVDVLTPPMIVQMTRGPYPSVLVIIPCRAGGTPSSRGDGSRNAVWYAPNDVRSLLDSTPERFTALTCAALCQAFDQGLC